MKTLKNKILYFVIVAIAAGFLVTAADIAMGDGTIFSYWITGKVDDFSATVKADGRKVDFYLVDADLTTGHYAQAVISGNQFYINAFSLWPTQIVVGESYKIAIEKGADNFGALSSVKVSGNGWDEVKNLKLEENIGPVPPVPPTTPGLIANEPAPEIEMWFGKRLYQKALVEKGQEFIISKKPNITIKVKVPATNSLDVKNVESSSIILDTGTSTSKIYSVKASHISNKISSSAVETAISALTIDYPIPDELTEGKHTFTFSARSSGLNGIAQSSTSNAVVTVRSGPVAVIGEPIPFPSPYSPTKNPGGVLIQYTLTDNSDIDLYIFSVSGEIIKKISCMSGQEGGLAGLNKVPWNGRLDGGGLVGNGIYVGTIVSRSQGKLLKKFKINVFD